MITEDKGHLYHAAKGGAEFLRGAIETIPVAGSIFVWAQDNHIEMKLLHNDHSAFTGEQHDVHFKSHFLVNIKKG